VVCYDIYSLSTDCGEGAREGKTWQVGIRTDSRALVRLGSFS
jgi:hypothetical protein